MNDPLLTVEQVAERLQVKRITVRRWIKSGRLKGAVMVTPQAGYRIPSSEVERLIRESKSD